MCFAAAAARASGARAYLLTNLIYLLTVLPLSQLVNNSIAEELYVLYQCGADAPAPADFPPGTKFFQIPLVSVVVPETVPYAALVRRGGAGGGRRGREKIVSAIVPGKVPYPALVSREGEGGAWRDL